MFFFSAHKLKLNNFKTYSADSYPPYSGFVSQSWYYCFSSRSCVLGEDDSVTWDEEMIYGCVCDSSWEVGLGSGQTQEPEWFGPDCSLRHCPSGDDPSTTVDETDCYNVTTSSVYSGAAVGIFHVAVLFRRTGRNLIYEES